MALSEPVDNPVSRATLDIPVRAVRRERLVRRALPEASAILVSRAPAD